MNHPFQRATRAAACLVLAVFLFPLPGIPDTSSPAEVPVRLAAIISSTGLAAEHGRPAIQGIELAVTIVNGNGGVLGRPLEVIFLDNASTPIASKAAAEKAADLGVSGVIGAIWSSHSIPAGRVLQAAHIPMISPASTKPSVTRIGDYIFRVCFTDDFQGQVMGRFAHETLGARTAVVMKNINEEYCIALADFFTSSFTELGGRVLWQGQYLGSAVDFSTLLTELRAVNPDVVFVPGYARDAGLMIRQARQMRITTPFLGGDGWDAGISTYAGEAALEGCYYSNHWHAQMDFEANRKFISRYRKRYGDAANIASFAPLGYDATLLFVDAIERARSAAPARVRDALAATEGFKGATGVITFNEYGDPADKQASILKYENGRWVFRYSVGGADTASKNAPARYEATQP